MASLGDTTNPSGRLIAAKQVQGTSVFGATLDKIGAIEDVMIDKASGRIAYAILSFGGFLGIGDRYFPVPWEKLTYNTELGGYVTDIGRDVLEGAPSYSDRAAGPWHDDAWGQDVYSYYGTHPFWDLVP